MLDINPEKKSKEQQMERTKKILYHFNVFLFVIDYVYPGFWPISVYKKAIF